MSRSEEKRMHTQSRDQSENRSRIGGHESHSTMIPQSYQTSKLHNAAEDILFCIDVDRQMEAEMKPSSSSVPISSSGSVSPSSSASPKPVSLTRIDTVKQAILLFVHSKLAINPNHRFAFASLGHSASWCCLQVKKDFTNDVDSISATVRGLAADSLYIHSDLTQLFRMSFTEAKKSRSQSRVFRLILIYCRSSVVPEFTPHWPQNQKIFTLDIVYLHDKPNRDNCPQKVFDALGEAVDNVSEYEGYVFESGASLTRILFRQMCILLSHPQQRCAQDYLDIPKSVKPPTVGETSASNPASRKEERGQSHDTPVD